MYDCSRHYAPFAYKFNGKERDSESGLDNFGARYDASAMGRFMTPDWAAKPAAVPYANFGNPQSLNLYSYVENNPTTFGDPDGHLLLGLNDFSGDGKPNFPCNDPKTCAEKRAAASGNTAGASTVVAAPALAEIGEEAIKAAASKALSMALDLAGVVADAFSVPAMVVLTPSPAQFR